jgi:hypothetical protein
LALLEAIRNGAHEWQDADHPLQAYRTKGDKGEGRNGNKGDRVDSRNGNKGNKNEKGGNRQNGTKPNAPPGDNRPPTDGHHRGGVCKKYNDKRGCSRPCPDGRDHACDVFLQRDNKICGSRNHNRLGHNSSTHGAPAVRR